MQGPDKRGNLFKLQGNNLGIPDKKLMMDALRKEPNNLNPLKVPWCNSLDTQFSASKAVL